MKKVNKPRPKKTKADMLARAGIRPPLVLEMQTHATKKTCRCGKCARVGA